VRGARSPPPSPPADSLGWAGEACGRDGVARSSTALRLVEAATGGGAGSTDATGVGDAGRGACDASSIPEWTTDVVVGLGVQVALGTIEILGGVARGADRGLGRAGGAGKVLSAVAARTAGAAGGGGAVPVVGAGPGAALLAGAVPAVGTPLGVAAELPSLGACVAGGSVSLVAPMVPVPVVPVPVVLSPVLLLVVVVLSPELLLVVVVLSPELLLVVVVLSPEPLLVVLSPVVLSPEALLVFESLLLVVLVALASLTVVLEAGVVGAACASVVSAAADVSVAVGAAGTSAVAGALSAVVASVVVAASAVAVASVAVTVAEAVATVRPQHAIATADSVATPTRRGVNRMLRAAAVRAIGKKATRDVPRPTTTNGGDRRRERE
jgi:hypothetical protein